MSRSQSSFSDKICALLIAAFVMLGVSQSITADACITCLPESHLNLPEGSGKSCECDCHKVPDVTANDCLSAVVSQPCRSGFESFITASIPFARLDAGNSGLMPRRASPAHPAYRPAPVISYLRI
jgi:hypothetical protein